ncbi:oligosaccharide flippase family protein [Adhaeribacter sp. BT258]|uniref:Oligosaccharide flippase family protein n=1 Tax=Adhaeribacter terrigena TaxID=2793070 RepID=A0ABS1C350_9BACT|nr:oligosaccharide flippase family protein [Adhaeribacter terrigena]MBK0403784.1 oligosaccharide flippase family protein [Adhaeribacter terrigena]
MGVIKKQGIQNTIISYLGMVLGFVNVIYLMPNFLAPEQVGLTKLLISVSAMFAQFSALGFANMTFKFFPYYRDKEKGHQGFFFMLLLIPFISFLILMVLALIFKPWVLQYYKAEDAALLLKYYNHILLLAFFTLLYILQDAYLKSLYKTVVSSFVQDLFLRVLTSLLIALYAFDWVNFETFVYLYIGINCSIALVLTVYIVFLKQLFIRPNLQAFKVRPFKEVLGYGMFSFVGNISSVIINNIDSLMILNYLSLDAVGIFMTANFVTSTIRIPSQSILKIVVPQVGDYWRENNLPALQTLYRRVTSINLVLGCLLFIGIWANIDNIYAIMPKVYNEGKYVFFFLGLARLFDIATGLNGVILLTSHKFRYDLLFNALLAAITIGTNYIFIPTYGINGAAFASMLAIVSINLARLFFVWAQFNMQPFVWRSLLIVGIAIVVYLLSELIPVLPNAFLDIIVRSAFIALLYGLLILALKASPDATNFWKNLLKRIR